MLNKIIQNIRTFILEEYKFLTILILLYIILQIPVNYYIIVGGGSSDISSRVKVEDKYPSKGSFNISYVTELKGNLLTYALSYIVPHWERESVDSYKYTKKESIEDVEFRSDLDLTDANGQAKYWAYTLANKEISLSSSKLFIITLFDNYNGELKVQDEIISIDGIHYDSINDYVKYLQTKHENDYVEVKVIRKGKEKNTKTKLIKQNDRIVMGIGLQQVKEYNTIPKVDINFKKSESGPSGGLITTLEIYNQLTKKDLTKGKKVVGTGTIEEDGTIGEIGGVTYKLLGASEDKADIFLVPSGENYKEALEYKKKKNIKIKLIKVKNIKDAINKLEKLQ